MGATLSRGREVDTPTRSDDRARARGDQLVTTGHTVRFLGDEAVVEQYGGTRVRWRRESGTGTGAKATYVLEEDV